ncbi:MAG: hypothetical protein LPK09_02450 [Hymenobacteraceae bacterium]|nr:hypothetical protein [Hymenobacteraceae bacterium]
MYAFLRVYSGFVGEGEEADVKLQDVTRPDFLVWRVYFMVSGSLRKVNGYNVFSGKAPP